MDIVRISEVDGDTYYIDCTKIVSEILGKDLVKKAYLKCPESFGLSDKQQIDNAKVLADEIERQYTKSGNIWFDTNELIIELVNDRIIVVKASEWGSLSKGKKIDLKS